ncbi:hypothetical protein BC629DRAFT_1445422 [Irpex lacteus]|nr:hypothetical protein BC629DRAFT_1445422 [Irpex lacteus]
MFSSRRKRVNEIFGNGRHHAIKTWHARRCLQPSKPPTSLRFEVSAQGITLKVGPAGDYGAIFHDLWPGSLAYLYQRTTETRLVHLLSDKKPHCLDPCMANGRVEVVFGHTYKNFPSHEDSESSYTCTMHDLSQVVYRWWSMKSVSILVDAIQAVIRPSFDDMTTEEQRNDLTLHPLSDPVTMDSAASNDVPQTAADDCLAGSDDSTITYPPRTTWDSSDVSAAPVDDRLPDELHDESEAVSSFSKEEKTTSLPGEDVLDPSYPQEDASVGHEEGIVDSLVDGTERAILRRMRNNGVANVVIKHYYYKHADERPWSKDWKGILGRLFFALLCICLGVLITLTLHYGVSCRVMV